MIIGLSLAAFALAFLYLKHPPQKPIRRTITSTLRDLFNPISNLWFRVWRVDDGSKRKGASNPSRSSDEREDNVAQTDSPSSTVNGDDEERRICDVGIPRINLQQESGESLSRSSGSVTPTEEDGAGSARGVVRLTATASTTVTTNTGTASSSSSTVLSFPVPSSSATASSKTIRGSMPPPPFIPSPKASPVKSPSASDSQQPAERKKQLPMFPSMNSAQRVSSSSSSAQSGNVTSGTLNPAVRALYSAAPRAQQGQDLTSTLSRQRNQGGLVVPSRSREAGSNLMLSSPSSLPSASISGSLAVPTSTTTQKARKAGRGQVALEPGYSPMDWAIRQRSGENLAGSTTLVRVTPSLLKANNGRKGNPAWSSHDGRVYNLTEYVPYHPGGKDLILQIAGKDGKKLFNEYHSWVSWDNMLNGCLVGMMVPEGSGDDGGLDVMEEMD